MPNQSIKKRKLNTSAESYIAKKKRRRSQPSSAKDKSSSGQSKAVADDVPFTLECPARKIVKVKQKPKEDVFGPMEEDGGYPQISITYTVRPGKKWKGLKVFQNFSMQDEIFTSGTFVYVSKHMPQPELPGPDATDAEVLAYDKENHWVGKVLDIRADSSVGVWLRVFWLYWPEELPHGRKDYHGNQELIMSNHMEIVNAQAVAGMAEVSHWDEKDEDEDLGHRFWRQFYDVSSLNTRSRGLSLIRRHCVCNKHYNPDTTMLKCASAECGIWNHQDCLQQATLKQSCAEPANQERRVVKFKSESTTASPSTPSEPNISPRSIPGQISNFPKPSAPAPLPRHDILKAEISPGGEEAGACVEIIQQTPHGPNTRTEKIKCLKCGSLID